jgi:hypothetical protein
MGLFLSMSGVIGGSKGSVVDALRAYAEATDGSLDEAELTTEDDGCLVVSESVSGINVLYPGDFFDWDGASEHLSRRLGKPVFSFHIHDDDLWMYSLYEHGGIVDQFNPVPDYWGELETDERRSWQGSAAEVARRVPGLAPEQITRYLVEWGDEVFESDERKKAYATDEFYYGDDWQLVDFMRKLGLEWPVDSRGTSRGRTYQFNCKPGGGSSDTELGVA